MICPNCQSPNRDTAKFCDNCGFDLRAAPPQYSGPTTTAVSLSAAARDALMPAELAAKLDAAHGDGSMEGERRVVTMLFSDVRGSTAAASQLDPEEWNGIMNGVYERMIRPVYQYEGTIARLMGDAILAFFGAPIAHEDDPQRAILAGLEIVAAIPAYRQEVQARWGVDIDVRVGINTGTVVVGKVGADQFMEYSAVGDAINVAARMEQTAEPGTVQVAEDTYRLAAPLFDFEDLGGIAVKGKEEPVHSYRVLAPKAVPGRLRGLEGHGIESPLVGRDAEFARAQSAVRRLLDGKGGILAVIGEAGLGKSRLIAELHQFEIRNSKSDIRWLEGYTLSFGQSISYWPFQEMLRDYAGISENDTDQEAWDKIAESVEALFGDESIDILPYLASLLSLDVRGDYVERVKYLDAETMGQQVFLATRLFFDDLHWLDDSSARLIEHLLPLVRRESLLIAATGRPEPDTPAANLRDVAASEYAEEYAEIALTPLSAGDSAQLVNNLLAIDNLPAALRRTITQKADGNPFFLEEIIRSLIDQGAVVQDRDSGRWQAAEGIHEVTIPDTLQGVIMARIDRLDDEVKQVLGAAAVIGRSFFYRVLKAVQAADEALDEHLEELRQIELIRELQTTPELEYIFRHAIAQEVTYENLLLQRRRELHARVGEAIERLFPDRLDEFYGLLAYHYTRAEAWEKAQEYLFKAGEQAGSISADKEALVNYRLALQAYERAFGGRWDPVQHADVESKIGNTLVRLGDHAGGLDHFEKALKLLGQPAPTKKWPVRWLLFREALRQIGHRLLPHLLLKDRTQPFTQSEAIEMDLSVGMAWTLIFIDVERFAAVSLRLLNRAERFNYPTGIARGGGFVAVIFDAVGRLDLAERYLQQALAIAQDLPDPAIYGRMQFTYAQHLSQAVDLDAVMKHARLGLDASRKVGDIQIICWNMNYIGYVHFMRGGFAEAAAIFEEIIKLGEDVGALQLQGLGTFQLGHTYLYQGRLSEAIPILTQATEILERIPDYVMRAMAGAKLVIGYLRSGQLAEAFQSFTATEQLTGPYARHVVPLSLMAIARAAVFLAAAEGAGAQGRFDGLTMDEWLNKAGPACRQALKYAKGVRINLVESRRLQGTYEWLRNKPDTARKWWAESLTFAEEKGITIEEALTRLEMGRRLQDKKMLERAANMFEEMDTVHGLSLAKETLGKMDQA
jgi:class 3 adenylate cyclase/tetratricopeptide (TPR) repeat protein